MKIFLSYASEQHDIAEAVQLGLVGDGHEVFFDRETLLASGNYLTEIERNIAACDAAVFLVSPESVAEGRYTLTEMNLLRRKWQHPQGRVLSVLVAPTARSTIPRYLTAVTLLEPEGNLAADVVHAVKFDLVRARESQLAGSVSGPSTWWDRFVRASSFWVRASALILAVLLAVFGVFFLLVRLDLIKADWLNVVPSLAFVVAVGGVLWFLLRRRQP